MFRRRFRPRSGLFKPKLNKGPLPTKLVLLYTLIIFSLASIFSLWFVDHAIEPIIMNVAQKEIKRVAAEVINESFHENMSKILPEDDILLTYYQEGDPAPTYSFNPKLYNQVRDETIKDIQEKLGISKENPFESDGQTLDKEQLKSVVYYVPLGVVTHTSLFANLGPKIPVEMSLVGHVEMDYESKFKDAGINNTYLELFARVAVNVEIVIPSIKTETPVEQVINVGGRYIPGKVPSYYSSDGRSITPAIVDPGDKN